MCVLVCVCVCVCVCGHMLDYVLVNRPFRTSNLDTRVYKKSFLEYDHMLVVANVRMKLETRRSQSQILGI